VDDESPKGENSPPRPNTATSRHRIADAVTVLHQMRCTVAVVVRETLLFYKLFQALEKRDGGHRAAVRTPE
jgi:hypothetical protein